MRYNFDEIIERRGSGAVKTDALEENYGREDLMPAWVADMDFATPPFIMDALRKRLEHPILGYTIEPADYRPAIIDWQRGLHGWELRPEWISYIPGIVKGIGMVINVFTNPGDNVVIMPPVYHPFRITTEKNGRKVCNIPLIEDATHRYHIDFESLEKLDIRGGLLILSNPHNPAGRMWSKEELMRLATICDSKGMVVISDEIHADMALWGKRHVPFASVSEEAAACSITFCAPSKTFNIPGVVSSFAVVPNEKLRRQFYGWLEANEFNAAPLFSHIATIAAYRHGAGWREEMLRYVEGNILAAEKYIGDNIPGIRALRPDASFLVWLDCRGLQLSHSQLVDLFVGKARVALNDGAMFGAEGSGMMRLNVATPRSNLMQILERLKNAIQQ